MVQQSSRILVPEATQVVEVKPTPTDATSLAWSMLDKVAQGSTAVIFALIILWWFSRKTLSKMVEKHNTLLDTLSQATRDNSVVQSRLAETIKHIGDEDVKTAMLLGKMDSKLKLIRALLIEVRSYQTGIPQNRLPILEVLEEEDDTSDLR